MQLPINAGGHKPEMDTHGIKAELLIPGRGDPIKNGVTVIEGKKIAYVGTEKSLPDKYKSIDMAYVPVLMPGLWDCHVHFFGFGNEYSLDAAARVPLVLAGARGARDVLVTLRAGFTSVRELAGYGIDLSKAIAEGSLVGPNIYSSSCAISQTGGHGDAHGTRLDDLLNAIHCGSNFCLCDGVDECMKAVRLQLRKGASVIKVCASGGVTSELDNPIDQQFSNAELKAMVEEANRAQRIVAAHCHGKAGIMASLNAGCQTIEHGTYLDDEAMELMKKKGAMLIATRTIVDGGMKLIDHFPPASQAKMRAVYEVHRKAYKMAVKAGVRIALGTDLGSSIPGSILSHGKNGQELRFAVEAGMTPLEAIEAATANAPSTLGPQAPLSGQLKEGYDADLIALSSNPLDDIDIFSDAENVTHVWKGGVLFKSPDLPVTLG
jgi:imidazolonepropionase-like amidohydrolase